MDFSRSAKSQSLAGAPFGPTKAHIRLKRGPKVVVRAGNKANRNDGADKDPTDVVVVKPTTDVEGLMEEIRKALHTVFHPTDHVPSTPTLSQYDHCCEQAFKFFTTTNTITPEGFHHRICKLGIKASRQLCVELFGRIDQEDLGEINYVTFARRVFLPERVYQHAQVPVPPSPRTNEKESNNRSAAHMNDVMKISRPPSASKSGSAAAASVSPRRRVATPAVTSHMRPHGLPETGGGDIALVFENSPLQEIENHIAQKLDEKISRGTDRFRQAFRFFTKSEGISFLEFQHHLELLQIHLSPATCRALFDRFDVNRSGTIELSEFTHAIFKMNEQDLELIRPHSAHHGDAEYEVEAGAGLTVDQIMARLREKLEQHTSKETDRFRQAFRIFGKSSGISPHDFNVAMGKLGLKLSDDQVRSMFDLFDFDKSGDLDLNEFVQGVMLEDYSVKFWSSARDRQKLEEARQKRYSMAVQSVQKAWTIHEIEKMLREKIEQRTSRSSDCFRQAFKIFKKVSGIKPDEFHASLESCGMNLDRAQSDILFARYDRNGSGDIDLDEFIHGVLPPDYTGIQWVAAADEMHRIAALQKKLEAKLRPDQYMTEIEMESWSLDEIERRIRDKIQQATSKSSDTFRQAFKIFKKSNHVTMEEFRDRLLALGFRLTPIQCEGLFRRYDTDGSGDLDLQEFCMRILPPDYTGDGDYWSHSEKFKQEKRRERINYVKRTKNGLLMLPRFDERIRYTRGHYSPRTFSDLKEEEEFLFGPEETSHTDDKTNTAAVSTLSPRPPSTRASRPGSSSSRRASAPSNLTTSSQRPASPTRPTSPDRHGIRPASPVRGDRPSSPRKVRTASPASDHGQGPGIETLQSTMHAPTPPSMSPQPRRPSPPTASPRTPSSARAASIVCDEEYEDEEVVSEEAQVAEAIRLMKAKRLERRQHRASQRGPRPAREADEESVLSGRSMATSSNCGSTSSLSSQKHVGTAKYTPQKGHGLLLKRFMMAKRQSAAKANEGKGAASGPRPKRHHRQ